MQEHSLSDFDFLPGETSLGRAAELSFSRLSFTFTREHLERLIGAALADDSSDNDRYVCACMLKNALVASEGIFPLCQDTGIANIFAWKKGDFDTSGAYGQLTEGVRKVYDEKKLRFSTAVPVSFYDEKDPKNNLPAQIAVFDHDCALAPVPGFVKDAPDGSLSLIFCAKGGGSSNKTSLIQGTKALLTKERFSALMREQIPMFGTSACPPYTIAVVAGGLSPEQNILALKLATTGAYDNMTYEPNEHGFRDKELEALAMQTARECGYGAQFGGAAFALSAVVVRLPRHGASCPVSFGVSCSAHRNIRAVITKKGLYIEKTVTNPREELERFDEAVSFAEKNHTGKETHVTSTGDIRQLLDALKDARAGSRIILSGKILVARDAAHARWQRLLDEGRPLPEYTKKYPICYAGPARTPDGKVTGSFGPTTAGRMDVYAESLMPRGAALITLAKGNRSGQWTAACKKYGALYLGTPGGIAALIASEYITGQDIIDYEDLGMEAVRLVEVRNLPCLVITDRTGGDLYAG